MIQERQQDFVFEYSAVAPHDKLRLSIVIEMLDVELVAVACAFGVTFHVQLHALAEIMCATLLDTCSSRPDKTLMQMLVHHVHHGIHCDAVVHGNNLQVSYFAILTDDAFMITAESKGTVGKFCSQFCNHLLAVCEQIASLTAFLTLLPTQYTVKRLRHIAVGRYLLHDIAFSVHGLLFMMEDKGLPFPGPNFFESLPTYQTLLPDT